MGHGHFCGRTCPSFLIIPCTMANETWWSTLMTQLSFSTSPIRCVDYSSFPVPWQQGPVHTHHVPCLRISFANVHRTAAMERKMQYYHAYQIFTISRPLAPPLTCLFDIRKGRVAILLQHSVTSSQIQSSAFIPKLPGMSLSSSQRDRLHVSSNLLYRAGHQTQIAAEHTDVANDCSCRSLRGRNCRQG